MKSKLRIGSKEESLKHIARVEKDFGANEVKDMNREDGDKMASRVLFNGDEPATTPRGLIMITAPWLM